MLHLFEVLFDVAEDLSDVFARRLGALGALAGPESLHVLEEVLHVLGRHRFEFLGRGCRLSGPTLRFDRTFRSEMVSCIGFLPLDNLNYFLRILKFAALDV